MVYRNKNLASFYCPRTMSDNSGNGRDNSSADNNSNIGGYNIGAANEIIKAGIATTRKEYKSRMEKNNLSDGKYKKTELGVLEEEPTIPDFGCFPHKVGLSYLPYQSRHINMKKKLNFNIMVIGSRFSGKTTFINTLFGKNVMDSAVNIPGTAMCNTKVYCENSSNPLSLNIIDTYRSLQNDSDRVISLEAIKYIEEKYRLHMFKSELPNRSIIGDDRVHCCIYFLDHSSGSLTKGDTESIERLYKKVNLIPVIGKSDTFTPNDMKNFKCSVKKVLQEKNIHLCEFLEEDVRNSFIEHMPYSVIGSIVFSRNKENKLVRGRKYLWGVAEVDNESHCDFSWLEKVLLKENMIDLILTTENYYEIYRQELLTIRYNAIQNESNSLDKNENGFSQLLIYHKTGFDETEKLLLRKNEILTYKQKALEEEYSKKINEQEEQFRLWKKKLIEKQEELNEDIKKDYEKYVQLRDQVLSWSKKSSFTSDSTTKKILGDITVSELSLFNIN